MEGITFRCLYENCTGGVIFSGTVMDHLQEISVEFKYAAGVDSTRVDYRQAQEKHRPLTGSRQLDYFFLASYDIPMIRVLLREIAERQVHTVILPYLTPAERLRILSDYQRNYQIRKAQLNHQAQLSRQIQMKQQIAPCQTDSDIEKEVVEFFTSPDATLQKYGVENRYFLYQNGEDLPKDYVSMDQAITSMEEGEYFEKPDPEINSYVNNMEERGIDLKKAGYIKKAGWLFYFGVYGPNITDASKSHYFHTTLVLFTGPVETICSKNVAKVYEAALNMDASCMNRELDSSIPGCVKCIYRSEYVTFRSVNKDPVPHEVFGHFLLGTYNLNEFLGEMLNRYSGIREMIRVNAIPNCGRKNSWNHCYPSLFPGDYSKFWYINIMPYTDSQVMLDVAKTSPRNRFLLGTDQISYCFNGTIRPKSSIPNG